MTTLHGNVVSPHMKNKNELQWNFNQNTHFFFIQEDVSENIGCEKAAILSRERWVKSILKTLILTTSWEVILWNKFPWKENKRYSNSFHAMWKRWIWLGNYWKHNCNHIFTLRTSVYDEYKILNATCLLKSIGFITHAPVNINDFRGAQGMWYAQVKGQVTEMHRLKVNSHCDTAMFISEYDITMEQP